MAALNPQISQKFDPCITHALMMKEYRINICLIFLLKSPYNQITHIYITFHKSCSKTVTFASNMSRNFLNFLLWHQDSKSVSSKFNNVFSDSSTPTSNKKNLTTSTRQRKKQREIHVRKEKNQTDTQRNFKRPHFYF